MPAKKGNKYAKGNKGGGRTSDYKQEYAEMAYKIALLGATDKELAEIFDVSEQTINNWKKQHKDFFLALKRGKSIADANIVDRLYQRAMGFEHDSEEIKVVSMGSGEGSEVVRVPVRKVYPPDTVAAIFWLKNRQKNNWRDKIEQDLTTKGESLNTPPIPKEQYNELLKALNGPGTSQ